MNSEQFEKMYQLLTGAFVGIWLSFILLFLFVGMYFINLYYNEKEKKDKFDAIKREDKLRDKMYLSSLEHRIRDLESKK